MKFFEWLINFIKSIFAQKPVELPVGISPVIEQPEQPKPPIMQPDPPSMHNYAEGSLEFYRAAYREMKFDPEHEAQVSRDALVVLKGKPRYEAVSKVVGLPWWVIGCVHYKEASCNFAGILHNGERIIGTGKLTTLVPKGRGPFATWEEAAIDAMRGESLGKLKNFEVGHLLQAVEKYNGTGYITGAGKSELSPYLWSRTSINDDFGIYVSDGKFDPSASSNKSSGFCAVMKKLELMGEIMVEFRA